jgi:ribosomal protein L29
MPPEERQRLRQMSPEERQRLRQMPPEERQRVLREHRSEPAPR